MSLFPFPVPSTSSTTDLVSLNSAFGPKMFGVDTASQMVREKVGEKRDLGFGRKMQQRH